MAWLPKTCVVVPYDFSEESFKSVEFARNELVDQATSIHIVHALVPLTTMEPGVIWDTIDDDSRIEQVKKTINEQFSDPKYEGTHIHVPLGDPGYEITHIAEELKAELIVIPSHGRKGISRFLLGSTAERVTRLAKCQVLVLKGDP